MQPRRVYLRRSRHLVIGITVGPYGVRTLQPVSRAGTYCSRKVILVRGNKQPPIVGVHYDVAHSWKCEH